MTSIDYTSVRLLKLSKYSKIRQTRNLLLAVFCLLVLTTGTMAQFANGSFETGDYTGWTLFESGADPNNGIWGIAANGQMINNGDTVFDHFDGINVMAFSPSSNTYTSTNGGFVALQLQNGPETHRMYQDITLPPGATSISWDMEYNNFAGSSDPLNQVLEINVRDTTTDAVLATLFSTANPEPQVIPMTAFSADVSAFAGQTVRISVDMIVNFAPLEAAFDNFRPLAPTAAGVTISGKVLSADGARSIRRALVNVTDGSGRTTSAITNQFGYFRFEDLQAGKIYVFNAYSKGLSFDPIVLSVHEDITGLNIFANPKKSVAR